MPFTATYQDPTTLRDRVRLAYGDTVVSPLSRALLNDQEIAVIAAEFGLTDITVVGTSHRQICAVAARCAEQAAGKLRSQAPAQSFSIGDYSETGSRAGALDTLATDLRRRAGVYAGVRVTGQSVTENAARRRETDTVQPSFRRGMHDHPGSVANLDEDDDA